ncbi:hypothetical protein KW791_01190 [Candidatus Parcubacteria bacterium]|nr:hypothetical protein [Candidatus Parcubacteria bacterium]
MTNTKELTGSILATAFAKKFAHTLRNHMANKKFAQHIFRRFADIPDLAKFLTGSGAYLLSGGIDKIGQESGPFAMFLSEVGSDIMAEFGNSIGLTSEIEICEFKEKFPIAFNAAVVSDPELSKMTFAERLATVIDTRVQRINNFRKSRQEAYQRSQQ